MSCGGRHGCQQGLRAAWRCFRPAFHRPPPRLLAAPDAFTFEAWLSTTDYCHSSAIFSYAARSPPGADQHQRTADANHFVIFDPAQLVACHDFEYM